MKRKGKRRKKEEQEEENEQRLKWVKMKKKKMKKKIKRRCQHKVCLSLVGLEAIVTPVLDKVVINSVVGAKSSHKHCVVHFGSGASDGAVHTSRVVLFVCRQK